MRDQMTKLKDLRSRRELTQAELAERSGVNLRTIQNFEQRKNDINKAEAITVYRLAVALHCDMRDLLEGI